MATKKTKRKKADSCWEGYSNYWGGKHHYKEGKSGRVRDCKSDDEIASMSKGAVGKMIEKPDSSDEKPSALNNKPKPKRKSEDGAGATKKEESTISAIKRAHKIPPKPEKK